MEPALPAREVKVCAAAAGRGARRVRLVEAQSLREVVLCAGADALEDGVGCLVCQYILA